MFFKNGVYQGDVSGALNNLQTDITAITGTLSIIEPTISNIETLVNEIINTPQPVEVDFLDEFQEPDGVASLWTPTGGNWVIKSNIYQQTYQHDLPYFSAAGEFGWRNYTYEADVRADSGGYVGIAARFVDINTAYLFYLRIGSGNTRLAKAPFNTLVETTGGSLLLSAGVWYRLKMVLNENSIKCYVDDALQIEHTDPVELVSGKIGLWCYWTATSCKYAKAFS